MCFIADADIDVVLEELQSPVPSYTLFVCASSSAMRIRFRQNIPIQPVASDCSRTAPPGSFSLRSMTVMLSRPRNPPSKTLLPGAVDLVDPPGEVDQQLVEALLQELPVRLARAAPLHVVDAPDRPGVHRRVQVGELPLVGRNLAVGVLELLEQQQPELLFGELRIDQGERLRSGTPGPRRRTRGTPICRASTGCAWS